MDGRTEDQLTPLLLCQYFGGFQEVETNEGWRCVGVSVCGGGGGVVMREGT